MNSAGDFGGILIILDVTALAFAQVIYICERDRTLGDRPLDNDDQFRGGNSPSQFVLLSIML